MNTIRNLFARNRSSIQAVPSKQQQFPEWIRPVPGPSPFAMATWSMDQNVLN